MRGKNKVQEARDGEWFDVLQPGNELENGKRGMSRDCKLNQIGRLGWSNDAISERARELAGHTEFGSTARN